VAGLFAFGVMLGRWWDPSPVGLWLGMLLAGVVAWRAVGRWQEGAMGVFLVMAGWTLMVVRMGVWAPDDLRWRVGEEERLGTLRGRLERSPEERRSGEGTRRWTNGLVVVQALSWREEGLDWRGVTGRVLVTVSGGVPEDWTAGAGVELEGVLRRPSGPAAPGLFDYREFLGWRGIFFELRTTGTDWRWGPEGPPGGKVWSERFQAWAKAILSGGLPEVDREVELIWAMTLGWRTALTDEVEEVFVRSGTMHLFAISGLHVGLLAGIVLALFRGMGVTVRAAGLGVIVVLWGYTAATGWQPSAVRATLMSTVLVGGWIGVRPSQVLNSLATAGWVVLLWDPRQLFQAGFQLSFAVVAVLGCLADRFQRVWVSWGQEEVWVPEGSVKGLRRWWGVQMQKGWRVMGGNGVVSVVAWMGSWPLTVQMFHWFTPVSVLANLVVVPLGTAALASAVGSLVCGAWAPGLSEWFNHGAWGWMHAMVRLSTWFAGLPWGSWPMGPMPWSWVVLWYAAIGWWATGGWRRSRTWYGPVTAGVGLLLLGCWERQGDPAALRVVALPARGGQVVWVEEGRSRWLVDTGDARTVAGLTTPFLRAQGVRRLPSVILTHGDIRHAGGVVELAGVFPVGQLVVSPVRFRSKAYREGVEAVGGAEGTRQVTLASGDLWEGWRVLHPGQGDRVSRADDGALVLWREISGTTFLLLGDLGAVGRRQLSDRHPDLRADVVIAGLPETGEPVSGEWLDRLRVRLLVVVDADYPATARADNAVVQGWREGGRVVYRTSEAGGLELRWDGGAWRVRDASGRPLAGGEGKGGDEGINSEQSRGHYR
jgi:ComEC/Rec2-related protein